MFVDPCLVVVWVDGDVNGGVLGYGVGGMPIAEGEFCRDGCVVGKLLELGASVVFSAWNADGCGAHVAVAMLVI